MSFRSEIGFDDPLLNLTPTVVGRLLAEGPLMAAVAPTYGILLPTLALFIVPSVPLVPARDVVPFDPLVPASKLIPSSPLVPSDPLVAPYPLVPSVTLVAVP